MLLDLFPRNRGMAASLQGCVQSLVSGFVAAIASPMFSGSASMLAFGAILFAIAGLVSWLIYLTMPKMEVQA
jgi:DHA1 family bicyclomycin/chloramphenicol resistance-like MFS transporter